VSDTIYSNFLATEIIKSWGRNRSNYIIVAPPMSNARALFSALTSVDGIRAVIGTRYAGLSIARLDTSDFKDNLTFARRVLKGWGVHKSKFIDEDDAVSLLNLGIAELKSQDKRGVLLIHRFHEALEKLGEDIGTALRNLEHDHGLRTIVELPVSLTCLRERWDALDREKPPFLASDWGQGHTVKYLKGYTIDEIEKAVGSHSEANALAEEMFRLTGGLEGLVDALLEPAISMKVKGLTAYANSKSSPLCSRLIKWLDKPKDNKFRSLIAQSSKASLSASDRAKLAEHDWRDMLISKDGSVGCAMIVRACIEAVARENTTSLSNDVRSTFECGNFERAHELLEAISTQGEPNHLLEAAKLLCQFAIATDAYIGDWAPARAILNEFENLVNCCESEEIRFAWELLDSWVALSDFMCDFRHSKKNDQNLRLEQFAAQSSQVTSIKCVLQLQRLRLKNASKLQPYLALKSVVEQPESLLQLYVYVKFNINFWKYGGMLDSDARAISALVKKPFRAPKKEARLGFIEMLYIVFWKERDFPCDGNLLSSYSELMQIEAHYEQRKEQVHSTSIVAVEDWVMYAKLCDKWLVILSAADQLKGVTPLPSCEQMFFPILERCVI